MSLPTYQAIGTAALAVAVTAPDDYLNFSCNWPTHQTNDIGILVIYDDSSASGSEIDPGAGWTLIDNGNHGSARIKAFWRRAASNSESAAGFVTSSGLPTGGSAANAYGVIITYRGCVPTGDPINATANSTRTSSTSCTFPTITTTEADAMILLLASRDNDSSAAAWSAITNAALGSITERFDAGITNGNGGGFVIAEGTKATTGAVGTTSSTVTSSAGGMITFALRGIVASPIVGSTTITMATTASLIGTMPAVGSTTISLATTGTMHRLGLMVGSTTLSLATSAPIVGLALATGATTLTMSASGSVSIIPVDMPISGLTRIEFSTEATALWNQGSTSLTFSTTGLLGATVPIDGNVTISFDVVAAPTVLVSIAGSSTLAFAFGTSTLRNSSRVVFNQKFLDVYNARMALIMKIDAQTNLILESTQYVVNGGFENSSIGWTLDSGWTTEVNAISLTGTKLAVKTGGSASGKALNAGKVAVTAGKRIIAVAYVRSASANGLIGAGVNWYDQSGTYLSSTENITVDPSTCSGVWIQTRATCIAPTSAAWARVFTRTASHTSGSWYVDNLDIEITPQDATNLNPVNIGSVSSLWNGLAISYTVPTTGSPATCTINVTSGTLQAGAVTVSYNASTVDVIQARSTTVRYYLYYLDAGFTGGTKTLNVTTSALDIANSNAVLWIGTVDIVVSTLGTGGSGSGPPGGGGGDTGLIQ